MFFFSSIDKCTHGYLTILLRIKTSIPVDSITIMYYESGISNVAVLEINGNSTSPLYVTRTLTRAYYRVREPPCMA